MTDPITDIPVNPELAETAAEDLKAQKAAERAAKKAEKDALKAQEKAAREAAKIEQNGVTKPKEGSITRSVWDKADELSVNGPASAKDVREALEGIVNKATIATQYARWRKFWGLTRARADAAPATETETAPVEAETLPAE